MGQALDRPAATEVHSGSTGLSAVAAGGERAGRSRLAADGRHDGGAGAGGGHPARAGVAVAVSADTLTRRGAWGPPANEPAPGKFVVGSPEPPQPLPYTPGGLSQLLDLVDDTRECLICFEAYSRQDPQVFAKCGHGYHIQCILQWLERRGACPICDERVTAEEMLNARPSPDTSYASSSGERDDMTDILEALAPTEGSRSRCSADRGHGDGAADARCSDPLLSLFGEGWERDRVVSPEEERGCEPRPTSGDASTVTESEQPHDEEPGVQRIEFRDLIEWSELDTPTPSSADANVEHTEKRKWRAPEPPAAASLPHPG
ncbi:hypothetical protein CDCA_CDCA18G4612 [Cyanidium caldarium]|uniref:RING-type E3 ubiquitin transferase n=1 Tax=Cyanidium caldarium TaxID=2771 RepID=A0AAV9J1X8_CYACA|nr:hypothetical protein CDCA_CDCA18G4612 [Cyanidium caldarium]